MPKETIDLGTEPNDNTGDDLRTGGDKINKNFDELYAQVTPEFIYTKEPISGYRRRIGVRTGWLLSFDRELTETGFAGVEGTDWENIGGVTAPE